MCACTVCVHVHVCACVYMCVHVHMCACAHVCMCTCVHVCMCTLCVCMCICECMCVYMCCICMVVCSTCNGIGGPLGVGWGREGQHMMATPNTMEVMTSYCCAYIPSLHYCNEIRF